MAFTGRSATLKGLSLCCSNGAVNQDGALVEITDFARVHQTGQNTSW